MTYFVVSCLLMGYARSAIKSFKYSGFDTQWCTDVFCFFFYDVFFCSALQKQLHTQSHHAGLREQYLPSLTLAA